MNESPWAATQVDDVFLPSVRVQLYWKDVESAVERGAVVPQEAHALWAGWASPVSGLRVVSAGRAQTFEPTVAERQWEGAADAAGPGTIQAYGLLIGLLAGTVLGVTVTYFSLG
jgi:hypothetical protein